MLKSTGKVAALPAVRPNEGLEADYRRKLERLIEDMQKSVLWWVQAAYKQNTPEMAQDASPAKALTGILNRLRKQWQGKFDEEAPNLAQWFVMTSKGQTDRSMAKGLKDAGFAVKFGMTRETNDIVRAEITENVSLIKSISSQYFTDIEGMVMRSVAQGRDVGGLAKDLEHTYGVTKRRAAFMASDQNAKSTANITRANQERLGITHAIWTHSRGGKHPRPSHVAANGKPYRISEGMVLDGEQVWPGTAINCKCVSRPILPSQLHKYGIERE